MSPETATDMISGAKPAETHPLTWADLGCGDGLFTRALAGLLPAGSLIYAFDKTRHEPQRGNTSATDILFRHADFTAPGLELPSPDGILMANSLHYVADKPAFLRNIRAACKPQAAFLLVEYDIEKPVPVWVPYPLSFKQCNKLFQEAGFANVTRLATRPSLYGRGNLYSALATDLHSF